MSINEERLKEWIGQVTKKLAHLEANQMAIINGDFCDTNTEPKEPLIEDEATAKLVRSWARHWGIEEIRVAVGGGIAELSGWSRTSRIWQEIEILGESISVELEENKCYPIDELCGEEEPPEPVEPTFVDLDERIKEKEEE